MNRNWKPTTCGCHAAFTRRHFLFGTATAALLGTHADAEVAASGAQPRNTAGACIFINLNGGASQLDTFDPKDGPGTRRTPIRAVSGWIALAEVFPSFRTRRTSC
jgi:hypothetical protein